MKSSYIGILVLVIAIAAAALWYTRTPDTEGGMFGASSQEPTMGTYVYTCNDDVAFLVTLAEDMSSLRIEPVTGMAYPAVSVLADSPTDTGVRFRSADFEFHGRGESVTLYDVKTAKMYECSPQSKPDEAPFNFGD